jgi:AcrR family transcriptional regulator
MEERSRRIVDAAIELAEQGGFEAVRLRDVAAQANVALGTLYRRFRSKEDLLLAALELQLAAQERRLASAPLPGATPLARVTGFFEAYTESLCGRPNLARALVRSIGSGAPGLTLKVASFHSRMEALITASLRGERVTPGWRVPSASERRLAHSLLLVWFASLTGWASGLHEQPDIVEHTRSAAELMLDGLAAAVGREA